MIYPMHDPMNVAYRTPVGAVTNDTVVTLRLDVPKHYDTVLASLFLTGEAGEHRIPMTAEPFDECDRFVVELDCTTIELGPTYYCFELQSDGGEPYYYGKMEPTPACPHITGGIYNELPPMWQITVYDRDLAVPAWYGEGITYQIFPDRFARTRIPKKTGCKAERVVRKDWGGLPEYCPTEEGLILNNDFFGGNIRGIVEKLDYLESLGVRTIYLNPIFEAQSNHRYDTANYERIDPMFGTEEEFSDLCKQAKSRGMHVILDGVFSHTGADSIYFNKFDHYDSLGAYQSEESPYYQWYRFMEYPDRYDCWWAIDILPATEELSPTYLDYIVRSQESIVRKWIRLGASGWRLDVADELPEEFIRQLRKAVKEEDPDAIVIGEVWEDASNKVAYGEQRHYFIGNCLDSVMNYPLREAILQYLWGRDAVSFRSELETLMQNYPPQVFRSLMNHIGTHDTSRVLTNLGFRKDAHDMGRDGRAVYRMTDEERTAGKTLLRLATAIQFTFPGSPTIYYGDEVGMEGFEDPFNRMCYPWGDEDQELLSWYRTLGAIRNGSEALCKGELTFVYALGGLLVYKRTYGDEVVTIVVNRDDEAVTLPLEVSGTDLLTGKPVGETIGGKTAWIVR